LRKHSYANLFYTEIRSYLFHEYTTSDRAENFSMTQREAFVSYVNVSVKPKRRIFFHFEPLKIIALNIAENFDNTADSKGFEKPTKWWIDGGNLKNKLHSKQTKDVES